MAPRFPVVFAEGWFEQDVDRASPAGKPIAQVARARFEREGIDRDDLYGCAELGPDNTRLGGCFKTYHDRWGFVWFPILLSDGRPAFRFLAFGVRHHPPNSHAPTVYQLAHPRRASL